MRGVGIIGCGLIGTKRAKALAGARLIGVYDQNEKVAKRLASQHSVRVFATLEELVQDPQIDIVIVATRHDSLAHLTKMAVLQGKHVLVEKPAARSADELRNVLQAKPPQVKVRIGYNHRCHRAIRQAKSLVDQGVIGPLMFVRGRYGHGGRLGYEQEWRANPQLSGGGELIDQGVHLIDLARWFLGDFTKISGHAATLFWSMPVDDNAFLLLRTAAGQVAHLHASCTEWKNLFSFEIYGTKGKLHIEGLGGSYGIERLAHYAMTEAMGPPPTTIYEYPMADDSWEFEFAEFLASVDGQQICTPDLRDGVAILDIVDQVVKESGYDYCA